MLQKQECFLTGMLVKPFCTCHWVISHSKLLPLRACTSYCHFLPQATPCFYFMYFFFYHWAQIWPWLSRKTGLALQSWDECPPNHLCKFRTPCQARTSETGSHILMIFTESKTTITLNDRKTSSLAHFKNSKQVFCTCVQLCGCIFFPRGLFMMKVNLHVVILDRDVYKYFSGPAN